MKRTLVIAIVELLFLIGSAAAFAECVPGTNWTASWTDSFGQTTYKLAAPCKAYIGIPFDIVATVTDSFYPNSDVGTSWSLVDNGTVIYGGGFNWITLAAGQWQRVYTRTYSGVPIDHTIEFRFNDLGQGAGAHSYKTSVIGGLTVDPYPPGANPPVALAGPDLSITAAQQNTMVIAGSASDADGDSLTYRWLEGSAVLQESRAVEAAGNAPLDLATVAPFSTGSHLLTLEVSDGTLVGTDGMQLTVTPPVAVPVGQGPWVIVGLLLGAATIILRQSKKTG